MARVSSWPALGHFLPWQGNDAHAPELVVDFRVVDDFPDQENALIREDLAGRVGEVDGAFHAVAEPELPCQPHGGVADGEFPPVGAEFLDDGRAVVVLDFRLDQRHHVRASDVDAFSFFTGWLGCWFAHDGGGGLGCTGK